MLRTIALKAIAIYEAKVEDDIPLFKKTGYFEPQDTLISFFSYQPLLALEANTFPRLSKKDLERLCVFHFQHESEHHYIQHIYNRPYVMVMCSGSPLTDDEAWYLFRNIQHAFLHPDNSGVSLSKILNNPSGYANQDHLIKAVEKEIANLRQVALSDLDRIIDRGERLNDLHKSTIELSDMCSSFNREAEKKTSYCGNC